MKSCHDCKSSKPISDFGRDRSKKDGLQIYCKVCQRSRWRRWYEQRPAGSRGEFANRKYLYNLTIEQYNKLMLVQGDECAIVGCSKPAKFIDHDHKTGLVRGVLCGTHNLDMRVVDRGENYINILKNYRDQPPATFVIGKVFGRPGASDRHKSRRQVA